MNAIEEERKILIQSAEYPVEELWNFLVIDALAKIRELEKLLVDTANWDNLSKEQSEELIELHKKYYPENYE